MSEPTGFKADYDLINIIPVGDRGFNEYVLLCPICGNDFTHVDDVQLLAASGRSLVMHAEGEDDASRVMAMPTTMKAEGRRHEIVLVGSCEGEHQFCIHFRQHKGNTFLELHEIPDEQPAGG